MADALFASISDSGWLVASLSFTNTTIDSSGDKIGAVFLSETNAAITHVWFRYGLRTGTPPTFRIGLQGVTSGGLPDGTYLGGGSPASATFTPPASTAWDGTGQWIALDNAYTPSYGQAFARVIEYASGTIDGSNNSSFTRGYSAGPQSGNGFPYSTVDTSGSWAKSGTGILPVFGYRTSDKRFGTIFTGQYTTLTAATNGHRSAMHFTLPAEWGDTFALAGIRVYGWVPAAGNSVKWAVWDASSELAAVTQDADHAYQSGATNMLSLYFTTRPTLSFGTKYYIGAEVASSVAVGVRGWQLQESDDRLAHGLGTNRGLATYNGSSWTDDDTVVPQVALILSDVTEPSGGGGGAYVIGG